MLCLSLQNQQHLTCIDQVTGLRTRVVATERRAFLAIEPDTNRAVKINRMDRSAVDSMIGKAVHGTVNGSSGLVVDGVIYCRAGAEDRYLLCSATDHDFYVVKDVTIHKIQLLPIYQQVRKALGLIEKVTDYFR